MNWRGALRVTSRRGWASATSSGRSRPRGDYRGPRPGVGRAYIDRFMDAHRADFVGRALEVREAHYCARFAERLTSVDIVDIDPALPEVTIVADLSHMPEVASDSFDLAVVPQTLQYIFDGRLAVGELHRVLAPGGVLLLTVPSCEQIRMYEGFEADYWRYTCRAVDALFAPFAQREVVSCGNCLAAIAKFRGVAAFKLGRRLWADDPAYPVIVAARAVKEGVPAPRPGGAPAGAGDRFDPAPPPQ
ncbi:MAG TPA: methyltransferase domain-containing protein [Acidimicrobiales bacterium]|nr:methyltransferase domain-containing protein [Acidimicrobiales bacterium]